jgi:hypothetical protein
MFVGLAGALMIATIGVVFGLTDTPYILGGDDGRQVIEATSIDEWRDWYRSNTTVVIETRLPNVGGGAAFVTIRTYFDGVSHGEQGGQPLVFCTRVSGGPYSSQEQWRTGWQAAENLHMAAVQVNIDTLRILAAEQ